MKTHCQKLFRCVIASKPFDTLVPIGQSLFELVDSGKQRASVISEYERALSESEDSACFAFPSSERGKESEVSELRG